MNKNVPVLILASENTRTRTELNISGFKLSSFESSRNSEF